MKCLLKNYSLRGLFFKQFPGMIFWIVDKCPELSEQGYFQAKKVFPTMILVAPVLSLI
jgi:hypothetical protein